MDALTRRKRMQGYEVLWLPGMDHAGIATQSVVEKQLAVDGKTKEDFGRELFIDKVWDWKRESGGTIGAQMRRIGDGVDWSRDRFTMDDGLSRAVRTIFKRLYDAGLIYQAERLVNWSPVLADRDLRPRGQVRGRRGRAGLVPLRLDGRRRAAPGGGHHPRSRRCSATPRSPCTPTTTGTARWSARRCRIRSSTPRSSSSPTPTSTPNSEPAQSRSRPRTTPTTSRSASGTTCRCRRCMDTTGRIAGTGTAVRRHGPLRRPRRGAGGARRAGPHRRREAALPAQRRALRAQRRAHRAAAVACSGG